MSQLFSSLSRLSLIFIQNNDFRTSRHSSADEVCSSDHVLSPLKSVRLTEILSGVGGLRELLEGGRGGDSSLFRSDRGHPRPDPRTRLRLSRQPGRHRGAHHRGQGKESLSGYWNHLLTSDRTSEGSAVRCGSVHRSYGRSWHSPCSD